MILDSAFLLDGKDRDFLELTSDELAQVREAISPQFKVSQYDPEQFRWLFRLFKIYYQRKYSSANEAEEKFQIFVSNLKLMNNINSQNKSFSVSINKFADQEEIAMPPGLMKSLHQPGQRQELNGSSILNRNFIGEFKLDPTIKSEIGAVDQIKLSGGLLKGLQTGVNKFAVKTGEMSDAAKSSGEFREGLTGRRAHARKRV